MKKYINKVICGDCIEVMKSLPDKCIDLVLTDPPYGIKNLMKGGGWAKNMKYIKDGADWDSFTPPQECFDELIRISKNQIIWGGNYFILPPKRGWLVWHKRGQGFSMAEAELAWTSLEMPIRCYKDFSINKNPQHPTQKPVELMVWCLENYLLKNWKEERRPIVFDGFAGSGTTGVACRKSNCDFILVEKEKEYCDIAEVRLSQQTLF